LPDGVEIKPVGTRVYVTDYGGHTVLLLETATETVAKSRSARRDWAPQLREKALAPIEKQFGRVRS